MVKKNRAQEIFDKARGHLKGDIKGYKHEIAEDKELLRELPKRKKKKKQR